MFTVQFIESSASLQVQSAKSVLVKFCIFLHKSGPWPGVNWPGLRHPRPSGATTKEPPIRHSEVRILAPQPATAVSAEWLPALCKEPTFPWVSGQRFGLSREISTVLRLEPQISRPSLRADFSISEICLAECPVTNCVFAETGSNLTLPLGVLEAGRQRTSPQVSELSISFHVRQGRTSRLLSCSPNWALPSSSQIPLEPSLRCVRTKIDRTLREQAPRIFIAANMPTLRRP
jgi:hypothetical protein